MSEKVLEKYDYLIAEASIEEDFKKNCEKSKIKLKAED